MVFFLVKESEEKSKIKLLFRKVRIYNNIIEFPINRKSKINCNKILKVLIKHRIKGIVLSKYLNNIPELKNILIKNNITIIDGTVLFKLLLKEIVELIEKKWDLKKEQIELSVLTNDISKQNKNIITKLAMQVKRLNIVTNIPHIFKDVEEYLYNECGIIIRMSNKYNNALLNSNIIINMDLEENELNLYKLPTKAFIINIDKTIRIKQKSFNGVNINNYSIIIPKKYEIQGFEDKLLYESLIINKDYDNARNQILHDKIQIYLDKL